MMVIEVLESEFPSMWTMLRLLSHGARVVAQQSRMQAKAEAKASPLDAGSNESSSEAGSISRLQ